MHAETVTTAAEYAAAPVRPPWRLRGRGRPWLPPSAPAAPPGVRPPQLRELCGRAVPAPTVPVGGRAVPPPGPVAGPPHPRPRRPAPHLKET
ncbi:hypothetical protein SCA03_20390 [Streptomyces cacaoi]|uniref:Uncharacterized protein n=1 Tax=Streptomyces cacaoi TaxID=1898 RepID=A0A4Y3QYH1_STRCI|nr:hypothetical protein SCA03_20390 [Streptomyces cacaoi]